MCQPEFARGAAAMQVVVEPEGDLAPPPRFRMSGHLVHVVGDAHNFGVVDTDALFASMWVSQKTAQDHTWLRWFFVESMAYVILAPRHIVAIHAACVSRDGAGILLSGASGAGKSTLAFACAKARFTYVADDCAWLLVESEDRTALGRPHVVRLREDAVSHFPEIARWVPRARPTGKIAIEVPTAELPEIATATRAPIRQIVFLARDAEGPDGIERVPENETLPLLMRDMPSYGDEINAIHQRTVERLSEVPAFRMRYHTLAQGIDFLLSIS